MTKLALAGDTPDYIGMQQTVANLLRDVSLQARSSVREVRAGDPYVQINETVAMIRPDVEELAAALKVRDRDLTLTYIGASTNALNTRIDRK